MENRAEKKKINREKIKNKAKFSLLFLVISLLLFFTTSISILAAQPYDNANISQLEQYLDNSSYSDFQKRMVLNTAQEAINDGISAEDTLSIIKNSIDNDVALIILRNLLMQRFRLKMMVLQKNQSSIR